MSRLLALLLAAVAVSAGIASPPPRASAQPALPSTFYGTASIDGRAPDAKAEVRGFVDGRDCTQGEAGSLPVFIENGVAQYVIHVMPESQQPGCGREGKVVAFTVGGRETGQTAVWKTGVQQVNLNAGAGTPLPLPTATPTPPERAATPTPRPPAPGTTVQPPPIVASAVPTDDIPLPFGSQSVRASVTPRAPGASGGSATAEAEGSPVPATGGTGGDGGSGLPYLLGGLALVLVAGAVGGVMLARRGANPKPRPPSD